MKKEYDFYTIQNGITCKNRDDATKLNDPDVISYYE